MEPRRRQQVGLAVLAALLVGGAIYQFGPGTAGTGSAASNSRGAGPKARGAAPAVTAPDVHLEALNAERPTPDAVNRVKRNPFRFKPKPPPPPPVVAPRPIVRPGPSVPAGPPPLPRIPLKFAAVIGPANAPKIAVLLDNLGHVIYGKEGETIEGRYKIRRIGVESIEISYLDGRGLETIRMSGS
jgi:hypothetical protein